MKLFICSEEEQNINTVRLPELPEYFSAEKHHKLQRLPKCLNKRLYKPPMGDFLNLFRK